MSTPRRDYPAKEATRDPIFLFQSMYAVLVEGFEEFGHYQVLDGEVHEIKNGSPSDESLSDRQLVDKGVASEHWRTEYVFFTRDEAEAWATAHAYRWPSGWRVYCVPAHGELSKILKENTTYA